MSDAAEVFDAWAEAIAKLAPYDQIQAMCDASGCGTAFILTKADGSVELLSPADVLMVDADKIRDTCKDPLERAKQGQST